MGSDARHRQAIADCALKPQGRAQMRSPPPERGGTQHRLHQIVDGASRDAPLGSSESSAEAL